MCVLIKCLRRIWSLPPNSHTGIVHCVSGCVSVCNVCFQRFCKLYQSACSSSNFLARTVFQSASLSCRNFIGHNLMFGKSFVRDYSSMHAKPCKYTATNQVGHQAVM